MSNKILCRGDLISLGSPEGLCLTAEPTFDGTGDVRCAVADEFSETCVFQIISKKGSLGSALMYGEEIQLLHVSTGLFLVTMQVGAELEKQCFKLLLRAPDSHSRSFEDLSIFYLFPRYKLRSEGEPVCEDPVLLQANLPSHFPHYMHLSGLEVNVSLQSTAWLPRIYRSANEEAGLLQAGLMIRLQHREYDSFLSCSPDVSRVPKHAKALAGLCSLNQTKSSHPQRITEDEKSVSYSASSLNDEVSTELTLESEATVWSLWVIQNADIKSGAAVGWGDQFRLRHLMTGGYLGINQTNWHTLAKSTEATLLEAQPSNSGLLRQGSCGRIHMKDKWLVTQNKKLACSNEYNVMDAFVFTPASDEEIHNFFFVRSRRTQLLRLSKTLREGDVSVLETTAQVGIFVQALADLARFCTVSDGTDVVTLRGNPIVENQLLLLQEDILFLVIDVLHHALEIVAQLKQVSTWGPRRARHYDALSEIVPVAYTVLRLAVTGNKSTQTYVANYLPILQKHLFLSDSITTQVLDVMRFVYTDNTALVESVKREDLLLYLSLLDTANAVKAPDFLSVFCHSGLAGIRQNQDLFLQNLSSSFMPKLRLQNGKIELQDERPESWVDLEAWFDPKASACINFRTKFRFLRSLTLGRNQRAIEFIRNSLSFECLLAVFKSNTLPHDLKRNVCEVLNRVYVDCAPNVQVLGTVPLIRADKKYLIFEDDEKSEDEPSPAQIGSQLKAFMNSYLDDRTLLNPKEWDIRSEHYNLEHWQIIYSISMFTLLRKMVSFGWYATSDLTSLSAMLVRVLSQSRPAQFRNKTERNHDVAIAKREIVKTLDLILSDSISRLVDQWLDVKRNQSTQDPPDLANLVYRDFGIVSAQSEEANLAPNLKRRGTYQPLTESKAQGPSKDSITSAEANVRHVLFEILLHDDQKLEHTATRVLMRLYNQHNMIMRVLQNDLVLEGSSEHDSYLKIQRHVEALKNFLYYNTWESNHEQILLMLRALVDLVVDEGDMNTNVQAIYRNMGLHTIIFGLINHVVLPGSPTRPQFYHSQEPGFRLLALEAYRLLYYYCFESVESANVLATLRNVQTMVQHLGVSEFVVKLLYRVVRGNNGICESFQPEQLDAIVACYAQSKNPLYLKLLAMLIQPNPQDIPLRLVQNQVCALLLHPKYDLLSDLESGLTNGVTAQLERKEEVVIDHLDFDEALPPALHVLRTLAMCTKGHNPNVELRCRHILPLDRVLYHLTRPDGSSQMRAVLLFFLHEVYVSPTSAQGLLLSAHVAQLNSLFESCFADITILATSEFKAIKLDRNSKFTHAALKESSKGQGGKKLMAIDFLQPQSREVYVLDVVLPFMADLLTIHNIMPPPMKKRLSEILNSAFRDRSRLQPMLSISAAGWSFEWTERSGMPALRAKNVLSAIEGAGDSNLGNVVDELNNIAKSSLALNDAKESNTQQLRFRGSAALSGRLQERQNETSRMLTEMFLNSLQIVMTSLKPEGRKESIKPPAPRPSIASNDIEMAVIKDKSDEIHERSQYTHNVLLWEAIVRFLTRQQDLSHKGGDVSIHLVDDAAHHTSADTLLGFLDVISRVLEGARSPEERRSLQKQLVDLHMLSALLSIVINCEKHEAVVVKAFQVITHIVRGGLEAIQNALLDCLRTPIGRDFMYAIKSRLRGFSAKVDPESLPRHTPSEVAVVMCVMEFLKLCFEGNNLALQLYLNGQDNANRHVGLIEELGSAFDHFSWELVKLITSEHQVWLQGARVRTYLIRGRQDNSKVVNTAAYYQLASACLKTCTDACLGPCHLNQALLVRTALPGVMRLVESIHRHRASKAGAELEVPVYEFWLSLLEGLNADRAAVHASFLEIFNLDVAFDSLTTHWNISVSQSRPPIKVNFQPNHECQLLFSVMTLLSADTRAEPKFIVIAEKFAAWQEAQGRNKLLKRSIVSVEFVREERIQRISFPIPQSFKRYNAEFNDALDKVHAQVSRGELSSEEKLNEFLRRIDGLVSLAQTEASLAELPAQVLVKLVRRQLWWRYSLALCLVINILVVTYAVREHEELPHTPYEFSNDWIHPTVYVLGACLVLTLVLTITRFMLSTGSQLLGQYQKEEQEERQRTALMLETGSWVPLRTKVWLKFLSTPLVLYYMASLLTSVMGLAWTPFFFAFHLLDSVLHNNSMNYMFEVVFRRWRHIVATIAIACIVAYFFSVIAFIFHLEYEFAESPYDCETMAGCVQMHFDRGFHEAPHWEHPTVALPVAYNLVLFFTIEIMLVGLVTGIIIDSFTEMRMFSEAIKKNIKTQCFICAIDRETFDFRTLGFRYHIKHEHRMWHYMYLREYLKNKQETGRALSGHERYLMSQFEARSIAFFPLKRAMSLEHSKKGWSG